MSWLSDELEHARSASREAGDRYLDAKLVADLAHDAEDEGAPVHDAELEVAGEALWSQYRRVEVLERALKAAEANPRLEELLRATIYSSPATLDVIERTLEREERLRRVSVEWTGGPVPDL
jgi:hypothetical protein